MYKLLIVEDDAVIRTSLSSIIDWEKYGISLVQSAENGKVAYSTILSQRVDIVLCDVKMPYVTGIELLEMVSKLPVLPLFYMLSAYEDFSLVRKAFTLGAQDYISKSELNENRFVLFAEEVIKKLEERSIIPEVLNNTEDICLPFINLKNDVLNKRSIEKNYDIPLEAQIIQVADSFDAMTSDRSYRKAFSIEKAISIMIEEKGKQFNPTLVDIIVKLYG